MLGRERGGRRIRSVYDADASTLCRLVALALAPAVAILWLAAHQFGLDGSRKARPDRAAPKRGGKAASPQARVSTRPNDHQRAA